MHMRIPILDLQDQLNTHSPENAENNIQELCDEVEETSSLKKTTIAGRAGRPLFGRAESRQVHPTSITPILSTITS